MKEKRLVTVLYADIAGFTNLTAELGAEKITDFMNNCFGVIDSIVNSYGGTVLRHEGDRVMAIYGFPKSRGKDSYYALITALRIKEATKHFAYPVGIHVGIATGEVIIEGVDIYGQVIEEASHLESLGENGELCINKNCFEINKYLFDFKETRNDGYRYYNLITEKSKIQEYQTDYLDRQAEFQQFNGFVDEGQKIVAVTGPGGIGKTRFVHESIRAINRDAAYGFFEVSFLGSSTGPFGGILRLIHMLNPDFRIDGSVELADDRYRVMLFQNLTQTLVKESSRKPMIVFLQNIDLIDRDSLDYLRYLVGNIHDYRIQLIVETRVLMPELLEAIGKNEKTPVKTVMLQPLARPDAATIVKKLTPQIVLPEGLVDRIIEFSQGNPLYVEESCHYIMSEFRLGKNPQQIVLPFRLRELAGNIIDTIPNNYLWGLSIFSAFGYVIDKRLLRLLISDYNEFVDYCVRDNLITIDADRLFFKAQIIRDELYARLSKESRQRFHGEIGKVLEESNPSSENWGLIAYHYSQASNFEKALDYSLKWGRHLETRHLSLQAIEAYSAALDYASRSGIDRRFEILQDKCRLYNRLGNRSEESQTVDRMIKIADESNNQDWLFQSILAQGNYLYSIGNFQDARAIYESLLQKEESSFVIERLGILHYHLGDMYKAQDYFLRLLQIAKINGAERQEAVAYQQLGMVAATRGEKNSALENYQQAKRLFEQKKDNIALGYLTAEFGNLYYDNGQNLEALKNYQEALAIANLLGDEVFKSEMLRKLGNVSYTMGEYEKDLAYLGEALIINRQILNRTGEENVYHNMGITYDTLGQHDRALGYYRQALRIAEETGFPAGIANHLGDMGICYRRANMLDEAILSLEKSIKICEQLQHKGDLAYNYTAYAHTLHLLGQHESARRFIEKSIALARESSNSGHELVALSVYARICLESGDPSKALELSREAVSKLAALSGIEGSEAHVYFTHYRILSRAGREEEARSFLERAYTDIRTKSERIGNPDLRASYQNLHENKEIVEQWERIKKPS